MAIQFPFYTLRQTLLSIAITILVPSIAFLSAQIISCWHKQPAMTTSTIQQQSISFSPKESRKNTITFSIMTILGIIAFAYGIMTRIMYLSSGFINGGLVAASIGYLAFYNHFDDFITLAILVLFLGIILFIAHRAIQTPPESSNITQ